MTEQNKNQESNAAKLTNFLIIGEWITIVGLFIGAFSFMQSQMQAQTLRTDALHNQFIDSMTVQSQRSDDLHKEFIDLIKSAK